MFGKGAQRLLVMSWRKALSVSCCVTGLLKLNCLKQQEVNISVSVSEGLRGTFCVVPALGRSLSILHSSCQPWPQPDGVIVVWTIFRLADGSELPTAAQQ